MVLPVLGTFMPEVGNVKIMKLRPLGSRVVVLPIPESNKTEGGLFKPETAKERPTRGKVVAVGPGSVGEDGVRATPDVSEGDEVLFSKYAGTEIVVNNEECRVLDENDIIGVVEAS